MAAKTTEMQEAADEIERLRAFKEACEGQEPSLFAEFEVDGTFAGEASGFPEILEEPIPLYLHPDPEAAQLRQQIAELEAQLDLAVEAFYKIHDTAAPYDDGIKFGYIKEVALDALAAIKSSKVKK